jgi:uncharacterized protein
MQEVRSDSFWDESMKIQLETGVSQYLIRAYAPGKITVNDTAYTASLVLTPREIQSDWAPQSFQDLAAEHFDGIAAMRPEVVILGTGTRLRFPAPACLAPLSRAGVGVEVMDTAAACRTYNILAADGRRVVAALLMIEGTNSM